MKGKKIELSDAKCTGLTLSAPVNLSDASDGKKGKVDFEIEAYTGEAVDRWWGKLVVSIDGIQAKQKMPIFLEHDRSKIIGYSLKSWKDGSFFVSGKYSTTTDAAKEAKGLAEEGFPWQASIGVKPLLIMELSEEASMEVNGNEIAGPAEVWLESIVQETSFAPLGADSNTEITSFSSFEEAPPEQLNNPDKGGSEMKFTLALLEKEAPELLTQIRDAARTEGLEAGRTEGAAAERSRIQAVKGQMLAGHESLIEELMFDGQTTGDQAAVRVLDAEKRIRAAAVQDLSDDGVTPVPSARTPEVPAPNEKPASEKTPEENWTDDPKLRAEFNDDKDAYLAFVDATGGGLVKFAGKK